MCDTESCTHSAIELAVSEKAGKQQSTILYFEFDAL
jgi:hypothetical protein